METTFSSTFHIIAQPIFHARIGEVFKENCISCIRGHSVPDNPDIQFDEDFCGIKSVIGTTDLINPHFHWIEKSISDNEELFNELKANGSRLEFTILIKIKGSRGTQVALPSDGINLLSKWDIGFKITFLNYSSAIGPRTGADGISLPA